MFSRVSKIVCFMCLVMLVVTSTGATLIQIPMTGMEVEELARFDQFMTNFMFQWDMPGGALAVMRDGRLVLARGYGVSDESTGDLVQPDSLFRIASVSKPITSIATRLLVERGQLRLNDHAFVILGHLHPYNGVLGDSRLEQVTVQQLLEHSAGLGTNPDPMFESNFIAGELGIPGPPDCDEIIEFFLTIPLIHAPGTGFAYSNYGYCVLAEVIATVSGMSYESFVQNEVLAPLGITQMQIGASLFEDRVAGETRSHPPLGAQLVDSVFPNVPGPVEFPYGGFHLEAMAGHGGWLASPVELVRLIASAERSREPFVLSQSSVDQMVARPALSNWNGTLTYYAQGWNVRPVENNDANWWHDGALPYNTAKLVRRADGITFAVMFNSHPDPAVQSPFFQQLDQGLNNAADQILNWPDHDLFEDYLGSGDVADSTTPVGDDGDVSTASLIDEIETTSTATVCASGCDFTSIQSAIDGSPNSTRIEIGAGLYQENLSISNRAKLVLAGAGSENVTLDGSLGVSTENAGVSISESEDIGIGGISIINSRRAIDSQVVSNLIVTDSQLRDNLRSAVLVISTVGRFINVTIENSLRDQDGTRGEAFNIWDNDEFDDNSVGIRNSLITGSQSTGILVQGNSELFLENSTVSSNGEHGLMSLNSGQISILSSTFSDNMDHNIVTFGTTSLDVTDSEILRAQPNASGSFGRGIAIIDGTLNMINSMISASAETGLSFFGTAEGVVEGSSIQNNLGTGLFATGDSRSNLIDSNISSNRSENILVIGTASVEIRDSEISAAIPSGSGPFSRGIALFDNAEATLFDSEVLRNPEVGILLVENSSLNMSGGSVRESFDGILMFDSGEASILNATFEQNDAAIVARADSTATITGNTIQNNRAGIGLLDSSRAEISNNTISNNTDCGVEHFSSATGAVTGQNNTITGNGGGNLCGNIGGFPIGFGGGR